MDLSKQSRLLKSDENPDEANWDKMDERHLRKKYTTRIVAERYKSFIGPNYDYNFSFNYYLIFWHLLELNLN